MRGIVALGIGLLLVVGCGQEQAESVAPDAAVLKDAANKPAAPKAPVSGGPPPPSASGLDPTK